MQIANPIYDTFFKYMISHIDIAKYIISEILGEEIIDLIAVEQEQVEVEVNGLKIMRYDYAATIQLEDSYKTVMIELQKSHATADIARFRDYLAKNYKRNFKLPQSFKEKAYKQKYLPIIAIYFLGFNLANIKQAFLESKVHWTDMETNELINTNSAEFLTALTHDSYCVQIKRIEENSKHRLHKAFSFFNQKYIDETASKSNPPYSDNYHDSILEFPDNLIDADNTKIIAQLNALLKNKEAIDKLKQEQIILDSIQEERDESFIEGKAEGEEQKAFAIAKNLKTKGFSLEDIAEATGLSLEQITQL
jgi:hypothetical protein